jgi:hypothetical protein
MYHKHFLLSFLTYFDLCIKNNINKSKPPKFIQVKNIACDEKKIKW